ncbi:MAG: response regulator transcription factor [Phormidesmis sp.]
MVKILVIEDEVEIRANLLELLALEGYDIIGADNGATGLVGALEHNPDLILCDVMMPELDGHDVLAALRQEPQTALTPFIFLTALADKSDIRKGMSLGADDYITKPFVCSEVIDAISARLEKQTALSEQHKRDQAEVANLQKEVKQFRSTLSSDQAELISDVRLKLKETLSKLNTLTDILKTLPEGTQRQRSLALVQSVCATKVKLLTKIPNFEYLSADILFDEINDDSAAALISPPTDEAQSMVGSA